MKKQFRLGFTLVELLVVISIIGMLAGLLLPAVNAAREAGRRAVCMNNQSQLALAIINYDSARNCVPPLRGEIGRKRENGQTEYINVTSWVGFLLPYMEFNQLYQNLTNVAIHSTTTDPDRYNTALYYERQLIRIKSLLCPSSDPPQTEIAPCHYVCNGGYQNAFGASWTGTMTTTAAASGWTGRRFDPGKVSDAVFFDYRAGTAIQTTTANPLNQCNTKCSIDYISSHSGTSNVILLSENERPIIGGTTTSPAGGNGHQWAYWLGSTSAGDAVRVDAPGEERVAFCFPINANSSDVGSTAADVSGNASLRLPQLGIETGWSYKGYDILVEPETPATTRYDTPLYINMARGDNFSYLNQYRRARPASNHPGIVLAAFADRSVRPIHENMDKKTFVWLCQPNSGQVVSGDAF